MKITVTMELTQENLSKLRALLPDTEIPGQVSMFDSPSEKPVEPVAEAPKTEAPASAPATEAPKTEDKPITKTDIRAVALKPPKPASRKSSPTSSRSSVARNSLTSTPSRKTIRRL